MSTMTPSPAQPDVPVIVERLADGIVSLVLNRRATRNALDDELVAMFVDTLNTLGEDASVRCIVLSGAGETFSAGGNVKDMQAGTGMFAGSAADMRQAYRRGIQRMPRAMYALEVPVIAAIDGPAIGAGLDLSLMCDLRIATPRAVFAESFARLGLISGDGGAWFLQRAVGPARAAQMTLTARPIDAATALAWGLVSELVEPAQLMPRALALAAAIAALPPLSVRMNKRLLRDSARMGLDESLEMAATLQSIAQHTADQREAVQAFVAKRPPRYEGR